MTRGKSISVAASLAALTLIIAGCGGATSESVHSQHVDKASFTGRWPLTVDGGTIACDVSKGGSITFAPDGTGDVYAENGTAMGGWAKQEGWKDFHDIWATSDGPGPRVDSSDLDAIGQKLCDEGYGSTATTTTSTTTTELPPQPLPADIDAQLRGFMSKSDVWDHLYTPAAVARCDAEGFDGLSPASAWQLPGGPLACAGAPGLGAWDGRVVALTVYFDPPVDAADALKQIATIFPADTQPPVTNPGANSSASADPTDPTGTCEDATFTSAAVGIAVSTVSPGWTGIATGSSVSLYSGGAPSGSDSAFRPGSVRQALIGLQDSAAAFTGC